MLSACSWSLIQDDALPQCARDDMIGGLAPLSELRRIKQQDVNRIAVGANTPSDVPDDPPPASPRREWLVVNDQEIDIGVRVRGARGLRAEQHDKQRSQPLQNGAPQNVHKTRIQVAYPRRGRAD